MYPFIRSGDWVDVALFGETGKNIRKGDIVLFKKDSSLYLHRALRVERDGLIAKGDMSFGQDGFIPVDDVLARVVSISRGKRKIDIRTAVNRCFSAVAADISVFLQYPLLAMRKIFALCMKILSLAQSLKV
ncbi:MAG: S26 family signal peptidase, partial [Candidatus Omnitrophica bacterium]|nr:S26 family signal peptidase [Candidatus Omnitrophota bacterium]